MNGEFLQSEAWARLQTAAGHEAVRLEDGAYGFVHVLPLVGKYLYTPRWPGSGIENLKSKIENLSAEAKVVGAKWVRIEPVTEEVLESIKNQICHPVRQLADDPGSKETGFRLGGRNDNEEMGSGMIVRAPHDMQPRETFVINISKSEEDLLAAMKPKTRYNIRLAEKKGVRVFATRARKYQEAFLDLITRTAERKEIVPHSRGYYEKFFTELPEEMCHLFVAEYESTVVAANLVMVCGDTATYLHGGSGDQHREAMAPFLLQWEQIRFAKSRGCSRYDFGGVRTEDTRQEISDKRYPGTDKKESIIMHHASLISNPWAGITRFKTGFSPKTEPTVFPGCYDIVLDKRGYRLYAQLRFVQKVISSMKKLFRI